MAVLLETSRGDLVIDLFTEHCPKACLNFLKLCKYEILKYAGLPQLPASQPHTSLTI